MDHQIPTNGMKSGSMQRIETPQATTLLPHMEFGTQRQSLSKLYLSRAGKNNTYDENANSSMRKIHIHWSFPVAIDDPLSVVGVVGPNR
jgi:hypothetical protein